MIFDWRKGKVFISDRCRRKAVKSEKNFFTQQVCVCVATQTLRIPDSAKDTDGRNDTLSLRRETEKGVLIDSHRLSIPLRGRCGMPLFIGLGKYHVRIHRTDKSG